MSSLAQTSSQTVGPYLAIGVTWDDAEHAVVPGHPDSVVISGRLLDGAGDIVPDGMVETWQADPEGRFDHPDDPRGPVVPPPGFRGFGRSYTRPDGEWSITTLRPGSVPAADGAPQAPHVNVSVFARGMLSRVVTRIYFPEDSHLADPVMSSVPEHRRGSLIATAADFGYRFDIVLQGENETVFFDL